MYYFNWFSADPIISVVVVLLILKSAWSVIDDAVHILLEGTPPTVDWSEVKATLYNIRGVKDIHDLHIWTITSGKDSLTCHLLIDTNTDSQSVLRQAICMVEEKLQITHSTIQVETEDFNHSSCSLSRPEQPLNI